MLTQLNAEQQQAVKQVDGPVIVFAGAGSGKTRALTHRIAYMIKNKNIPPFTILAITFTNKATNEMKERLDTLISTAADGLTVSTFHSLFAKILRREIHHLEYSNYFTIIDESDQLQVINEVLDEENIAKDVYPAKRAQRSINYYKSHNVEPEYSIEKRILEAYENKMKANNLLDFEDLLIKTYQLFLQFPTVLAKYQQRYRYILVDEFQDTSKTQYNILKMLTEKSRNLFVVGDDDQRIYDFRGANYENIRNFKRDFPERVVIKLTQNYRSTQTILDGCNRLIGHNVDREKKELWSDVAGSDEDIIIRRFRNQDEEVYFLTNEIKQQVAQGKVYNDFAVLYRSTPIMRNVETALISENIPYRVFGGISYLRRREIKDIIAYLKLVVDHNDLFSFKRVVNIPARGIGAKTVETIENLYNEYQDLPTAIKNSHNHLSKARHETLVAFLKMLEKLSDLLNEVSLLKFYDELLKETGYVDMLIKEEDSEERIDNLEEFKSILYKYEHDANVFNARDKLQLTFDEAMLSEDRSPSIDGANDAVTLSTVHSSKGLEFKNVFFIGLDDGIFPNNMRIESSEELEEERRIAYVGMTRAKEKLYLLGAWNRLMYGRYQRYRPSRFCREFAGDIEIEGDTPFTDNSRAPSRKQTTTVRNTTSYKVMDRIIHTKYGEGVIVGINGNYGNILFTNEGVIRKFDLSHEAITKKK